MNLRQNGINVTSITHNPPLTEFEWRPSGKAGEFEWRGTLRGYLSDLVKDGTLRKDVGPRNKRWFSVIHPDEWNFLLE